MAAIEYVNSEWHPNKFTSLGGVMVRVGPSSSGGNVEKMDGFASELVSPPSKWEFTIDSSKSTFEEVPVTLANDEFTNTVVNKRQQLRSATDFW